MEPLGITTDDCGINSKYKDILHRSSMLSIPLIRCDDPVFNGIIKEEITEEIDHRSFQIGTETEDKVNTIDKEIKTEVNCIDCFAFEGTSLSESNSADIITNCLRTNPLDNNSDKMYTASKLRKHTSAQTGEKTYEYKEKVNTIDEEIKTEVNYVDCFEFEGTALSESYSADIITNCRKKNPLDNNCDKMSTASKFSKYTRTHTVEKQYKCDNCDQAFSQNHI
eukprot:XP_008178630.1 PREDICTED: putative zinc finger protein 66 [Acyrthosiphon pisum]